MIPFCHTLGHAIYVPYTEVSVATQIALIGYDWQAVPVAGDPFAYGFHFRQRWEERRPFINIEHDCIPWPGAIDELIRCGEPWCCFDYSLPSHRDRQMHHPTTSVPLGCMKIGERVLAITQGVWDEPQHWMDCDGHMTEVCRGAGFEVHQHFPGIVNANPAYLREELTEYSTSERIASRAAVSPAALADRGLASLSMSEQGA